MIDTEILLSLFKNTVTLITFLGFYLCFYRIDKKRFSYYKKKYKVLDLSSHYLSNISSLYLTCNEEKITNVSITITRIALWNSGTEDITEEKIVKERPLILGVKEGSSARILDCSVYYRTDEYNMLKPQKLSGRDGDNKYKLSFEYIEKRGGVILEVIHTGYADDLYMDCHIKGGEGIIEIDQQRSKVRKPSDKSLPALYVRVSNRIETYLVGSENYKGTWYHGSFIFGMLALSIAYLIAVIIYNIPLQLDKESALHIAQTIFNLGTTVCYFAIVLSIIGIFWPFMMPRKLRRKF